MSTKNTHLWQGSQGRARTDDAVQHYRPRISFVLRRDCLGVNITRGNTKSLECGSLVADGLTIHDLVEDPSGFHQGKHIADERGCWARNKTWKRTSESQLSGNKEINTEGDTRIISR